MEPVDPQHVRISDADRHRVGEVLREAAGEGRLDIEELEQRLEAAYAAKTYGDLVPIVADLPGSAPSPAVPGPQRRTPAARTATYGSTFALMGDSTRRGVWDLGEHHTAVSVMGSVTLDLREARFPTAEVVIDAHTVMGSVVVLVDRSVEVRVEGVGVMGSYQEGRSAVPAEITADSPRVRLRGLALMGSVEVVRKDPRSERRQLRDR